MFYYRTKTTYPYTMEQSRHYMKSAIIPDSFKIGQKQPPLAPITNIGSSQQTMNQLALKFAHSCNLFYQYIEQINQKKYGLNPVSVSYTDSETGELFYETITQKELDARNAFEQFSNHIEIEGELPTYEELMLDSDEESESEYESDEWIDT